MATIDRGSGPTVLFLHGQPGSGASWDPVTILLEDRFRVLAPDRPGYGATPGEARGVADNAAAAADLLDALGAGPATVVGHSWSGGAAVLLADRRPDLVQGLVLVGAACTPDSLDVSDRLLALPVLGEVLTVAGLLALGEVLPKVRRLSPGCPSASGTSSGPRSPTRGSWAVSAVPSGAIAGRSWPSSGPLVAELPDVDAALARIRVPTAVVVGSWDVVVRPSSARTLAAAITGAELVPVPRSGHFLARDAPDQLASVVARTARDGALSR